MRPERWRARPCARQRWQRGQSRARATCSDLRPLHAIARWPPPRPHPADNPSDLEDAAYLLAEYKRAWDSPAAGLGGVMPSLEGLAQAGGRGAGPRAPLGPF